MWYKGDTGDGGQCGSLMVKNMKMKVSVAAHTHESKNPLTKGQKTALSSRDNQDKWQESLEQAKNLLDKGHKATLSRDNQDK
ncbi:hypothetical protein PoB_001084200 [Plakobranchus ocellatus]|uniref:Uncharacterized protein n=1 Tax=Plakobranchus ocellatus TaxID=259542 RepID=A0AAV3YQC8_9GAST|nr:hypothetical protein PoB_001084200 [Plakobranchus ocellatus]